MNRKDAIVKAAKARAKIVAYVKARADNHAPAPTLGNIFEATQLDKEYCASLLDRMVRNKQLASVPVQDEIYFKGYILPAAGEKSRVQASAAPVDIVLGKDGKSVSLQLAGLRLRISVE